MTSERRRPRRGVESGLRTAAVWATVATLADDRRRELGRPLRVLDLGGGTGGMAVPLAQAGHEVIVVDPSPDALASLRRRVDEAGVSDNLRSTQGDADDLRTILKARVDLVTVHGTLEVIDDPQRALRRISEVVVPGGHLSVVTAQRLAAVLARALAGQFDQARAALESEDGRYGRTDPLPRRFDKAEVEAMVTHAGFTVVDSHGVRLFSDLVPSVYLESDSERGALVALEQAVATHPEFGILGQIGSALHVVARRHN
ncbi:methyltransferase domain-containing protein [Nostocoides australiense]|nr:methyltransferase domain-containing protein [Tetrasphaera sp.]HPF80900.1 methyltransferase domain-containing protein [Tetrasphaera australiensis]HRW01343.1 methyltransferase domain-containing protein [Tetrasphaera sp.]